MKDTVLLERTVVIRAGAETVFRFFTDPSRFAAWWGQGSTIDPRIGGEVRIQYPGGPVAQGTLLEMEPNRRVVFTFAYVSPQGTTAGPGLPPDSWNSRVTIELESHRDGTLVRLAHELPDEVTRKAHDQGWRFYLSTLAAAATREQHGNLEAAMDRYFTAWNEDDPALAKSALEAVCESDIVFRDSFGATDGLAELLAHIASVRQFAPGATLQRQGSVVQCHGYALVDWAMLDPKGQALDRGRNFFELSPESRIRRVVGFATNDSASGPGG